MIRRPTIGFTLLEVTLVMVIIAIIGVVADFDLPGAAINLRAQAEQLAGDIRYAQSLSLNRNERYRVVFTSTTYSITNQAGTAVAHPGSNATSVTLASQITMALANLPNSLVAFDGRGAPYIDTGLPGTALAATATITLTSGTETHIIQIVPQTGHVTLTGGA